MMRCTGTVCLVSKSCPTHCRPVEYSPPGSSVRGIFQARILECIATSFSKGQKYYFHPMCRATDIAKHLTVHKIITHDEEFSSLKMPTVSGFRNPTLG